MAKTLDPTDAMPPIRPDKLPRGPNLRRSMKLRVNPQMPMGSPLLLRDRLTVASGKTVGPDPSRMMNPLKTALWIDEIRLRSVGSENVLLPITMKLKLDLGGFPLTNYFVPFGCFGKVLNDDSAERVSYFGAGQFTWRLSKPLYVPRGEYLAARLGNDAHYGDTTSRMVEIEYAARVLPASAPKPSRIEVPWVTAWISSRLAYGSALLERTSESDILNPFDVPMRVQRFVGRTQIDNGTTANTDEARSVPQSIFEYTSVRAVDSQNRILIRDWTPFAHVFQYPSRVWNVGSVLPPKGFYLFDVDRDFTDATQFSGSSWVTSAISMVGYREVAL